MSSNDTLTLLVLISGTIVTTAITVALYEVVKDEIAIRRKK